MDMATETEMGEIDDNHMKEEGNVILNGDINNVPMEDEDDSQSSIKRSSIESEENDAMQVDDVMESDKEEQCVKEVENNSVDTVDNGICTKSKNKECKNRNDINFTNKTCEKNENDNKIIEKEDNEDVDIDDVNKSDKSDNIRNGDDDIEVHEIDDDDEETDKAKIIEVNDSGEGEGECDDVMIIEPRENGAIENRRMSDDLEVIEIDSSPVKNKKLQQLKKSIIPRRSVRRLNKQRSYIEKSKDHLGSSRSSEESDVEEVIPEDPLAVSDGCDYKKQKSDLNSSSTIVVKDTKRLVEIAAKSNNSNMGNKKEPTLVIIDTNSILSGRGPVPVGKTSINSSVNQGGYPSLLPIALPAQGMYPPNMRATITPIPMSTSSSKPPAYASSNASSTAPVLPTLTDDMFVVEAPSFIVPYVYEKPPVKEFKEFVQEIKKEILKNEKKSEENSDLKSKKDEEIISDDDDNKNDDDKNSTSSKDEYKDDDSKAFSSYFPSPLGKFFIDIGFNLVQEFVQSDLLRQQKRKRDREGGHNPTTNKTIHSLIKNLEFSKENNEPFKIPLKKCSFCSFKTESGLALAHHLETPHTKNYVYKCNFCTYEVRSPHDILFHMEAEHAVRGRLERPPAFHQCPNCPFEDNQKGKLTRHLVACTRKFKPEKNLEPPIDWEPPAKIPRVPKSRQNINASAYQAMKTSSQLQFLSKIQMLNTNQQQHPLHRGRGRPSLGSSVKGQPSIRPSSMLCKPQNLTGGSVLVPTNYQLSGNQLYQQNQSKNNKSLHQPSISITPLPRQPSSPSSNNSSSKPGDTSSKNSFVICEICDGYIKDLEQLRNHMQWIHKVKIHPKMIYNRPPLNCQKCQFRFFTDQGLERHLLGSHGLVTSSMQDAANKSKDAGRCPVCGRVYQWKLLNHVARDHNMTLKPAHLSYKCTVCTATFGMYKQFENHVYSAHSVVAKRVMDKKNSSSSSTSSKSDTLMQPLKINDEITIIPQPAKIIDEAGSSKEDNPNSTPSTSKSR